MSTNKHPLHELDLNLDPVDDFAESYIFDFPEEDELIYSEREFRDTCESLFAARK